MNEYNRATVVLGNETKTLGLVEPFNGTSSHVNLYLKNFIGWCMQTRRGSVRRLRLHAREGNYQNQPLPQSAAFPTVLPFSRGYHRFFCKSFDIVPWVYLRLAAISSSWMD